MEGVKQKKVAAVVQQALSEIFQKESFLAARSGLVTISQVIVSPDLSVAKVYLSLFRVKEEKVFLSELEQVSADIRGKLGNKIRNQVRHIPALHFFLDDSLDEVFRLEELFKQIKKK